VPCNVREFCINKVLAVYFPQYKVTVSKIPGKLMFSRELCRAGRVCRVDWFGEARSITVKFGLRSLKTCYCSILQCFAHSCNALLTLATFCLLLLTLGHFCKRPAGSTTIITVLYYGNANQEMYKKWRAHRHCSVETAQKKVRTTMGDDEDSLFVITWWLLWHNRRSLCVVLSWIRGSGCIISVATGRLLWTQSKFEKRPEPKPIVMSSRFHAYCLKCQHDCNEYLSHNYSLLFLFIQ
jgi:hypothetical protein